MSALGQYRTSGPAQKKAGAVSALAFVNDLLLRVGGSLQAFFELLDVLRRQLRAVKLDREFVEFGRQRERWLVVGVVDAGQSIGTDVEALVPLQDRRQGLFHFPGGDDLAVEFQRANAGATDAGEVVERQRARTKAVVLEVELDDMPAGRDRVRAFPLETLKIEHVPQPNRFALQQIEAVAPKAAAGGEDDPFGTALRHLDVGGGCVGRVEQQR